jgi:hypothetical protein
MFAGESSREKYDDEFHQHNISQDHEQRGQDYRARGRAAQSSTATTGVLLSSSA